MLALAALVLLVPPSFGQTAESTAMTANRSFQFGLTIAGPRIAADHLADAVALDLDLTQPAHVCDSDAPNAGDVLLLRDDWKDRLGKLEALLANQDFSDEDVAKYIGNLTATLQSLNYCGGATLAGGLIAVIGQTALKRTAPVVQNSAADSLIGLVTGQIQLSVSCALGRHLVYDTTSAPLAAIDGLDQIYRRNDGGKNLRGKIVQTLNETAATNPDTWISLRAFDFLRARAPELVGPADSRRRSLNLAE